MKIQGPLNFLENELTFEELGTGTNRVKKHYLPGVILLCGAFFVNIVLLYLYFIDSKETPLYAVLICFALCLFATFISYVLYEDIVNLGMYSGQTIQFYGSSPNKKEVDDFLLLLKTEQKKYLLSRYAKADPYLTEEHLSNNVTWLWDKCIIDNTELENLRQELIPKPTQDASIGFKLGNLPNK